jgi:phosphoribosyl 1,2-cyclic phosphodiesterase
MKIKFWGVRGSIPTPGRDTIRYGGNTPCIEIRPDPETLLILDAGTGIARLGDQLVKSAKPVKAYLLLSHTHWDHIQGFPFFYPATQKENELTIIGCGHNGLSLESILADQMRNMYFPLQFNELEAKIDFKMIDEESLTIGDTHIESMYVNHPGYTLGFRITHKGKSVVYISDNEPFNAEHSDSHLNRVEKPVIDLFKTVHGNPNSRIADFARDTDLLIHDSMFTPGEYRRKEFWGHSDYLFAVQMAAEARAKKLVLFHHGPHHIDDDIDAIVEICRKELQKQSSGIECIAAAEGLELSL